MRGMLLSIRTTSKCFVLAELPSPLSSPPWPSPTKRDTASNPSSASSHRWPSILSRFLSIRRFRALHTTTHFGSMSKGQMVGLQNKVQSHTLTPVVHDEHPQRGQTVAARAVATAVRRPVLRPAPRRVDDGDRGAAGCAGCGDCHGELRRRVGR